LIDVLEELVVIHQLIVIRAVAAAGRNFRPEAGVVDVLGHRGDVGLGDLRQARGDRRHLAVDHALDDARTGTVQRDDLAGADQLIDVVAGISQFVSASALLMTSRSNVPPFVPIGSWWNLLQV
jgi:hypothetical protein